MIIINIKFFFIGAPFCFGYINIHGVLEAGVAKALPMKY